RRRGCPHCPRPEGSSFACCSCPARAAGMLHQQGQGRPDATRFMPFPVSARRSFSLLALLEDLQVRGVARVVPRLWIDLVHRMVDGHGRLAEAGCDQLQLALVRADVTGRVHARKIRLEALIDLDRVLLDLEAPCCDGPEVRLEAD